MIDHEPVSISISITSPPGANAPAVDKRVERILIEYGEKLVLDLRRSGASEHDAEDVLQDVLLQQLLRAESDRNGQTGSFGYLRQAARNRFIDTLRRNRRRVARERLVSRQEIESSPLHRLDDLSRAIEKLEDKSRLIVERYLIDRRHVDLVAASLGIKRRAVYTRAKRAIDALRELLGE